GGQSIVVTTYSPSGDTCDMKPMRRSPVRRPLAVLHWMTFSSRIAVSRSTGVSVYMPRLCCNPSRSIPSVLPSFEKEWQLAHIGTPSIIRRLRDVAQPPGDQPHRFRCKWLDDARLSLRRHQWHVAIEDRRPNLICRGVDCDASAGNHLRPAQAGERHRGCLVLLDRLPQRCTGS